MIRFMLRWMAPILSAFVACTAMAESPGRAGPSTAIQDVTTEPPAEPRPLEDHRLPATKKSNGAAKWTIELARQVYATCPGDALIEALNRGVDLAEANERMAGECARNTVFVRNDSELPIQCKVRLDYAKPDHAGSTHLEEDRVIFPKTEDATLISYASAGDQPRTPTASCFVIPDPPPPYEHHAECKPKMEGPSPDDFYPPGPKHRQEEGNVTLEYKLTATGVPADVRVVTSSGIAELDSAALKYSKVLSAKSDKCTGQRTRFRVAFRIVE